MGSPHRKNRKVLPRYARDYRNVPKVHRDPQFHGKPPEKLQVHSLTLIYFHFRQTLVENEHTIPLWEVTHPLAWGALTAIVYDVKCSEADDRPTEYINRKSLFPTDKTLHITTAEFILSMNE